jgi:hypothetical protein
VSYSVIVQTVVDLIARPPLAGGSCTLLVDYTGVGRAVFDMLVQRELEPIGITITGGSEVHVTENGWNVPKRDLITATQVALQDGRLRIAAGLEHAPTLTRELLDYRVRISAAGHDSYDAREGQHDDLVLSTALCAWFRDWHWHHHDRAAEQRGRIPQEAYR